ncbi:hypothetical protein C7974DRAFT_429750 [Boeremia exigua]|uniref:uncharacterized protein n=1 Tax=Boeremia exigua TaxID=749465 RepID=UPI001E8DD20E|nr:uncharacterized protein C7974DRAFT_429750 [Boeremia exigua]KAH6643727.1 hypothetical protein C7974DRAFT_429750 [Boeremia exigua]
MSTATANKPPATGTPARSTPSRVASSTPAAASRTPARASTPTSTGATGGVARTRSVRSAANGTPVSARASVKKPAPPSTLRRNSSQVDGPTEEDSAAAEAKAAYLQDLEERLQKAEADADERQKQIEVLNARLDDAHTEQSKLEERAHEEEEKVESLENEKKELTRQHRELEGIYEAERAQAMKEKESTQAREEELQETIQRLKETMATKNVPGVEDGEAPLSRASSFRNNPSRSNSSQNLENFAPPSSVQRSNSRSNSKLIHQKDKIIEDLRLELAEYQVKMLEVENAGGGRTRELEKQLLETRMTNARLMEDNESFQLLLGEKTLNGDLSRGDFLRESSHAEDRPTSRNGPSTSLADELEDAEDAPDVEIVRKLEVELNSMKDQNKALTLYINKIIGRLLTYQGFESVLGNDMDEKPNTNKDLPPPPADKDSEQPTGFLQRAKSVVGAGPRKQRPASIVGLPGTGVHEDPATAPSIPIAQRAPSGSNPHRRSASINPDAANIVNTMYRMPPPSVTSGQTSPGLVSPRNSFFGIPIAGQNSNPASRVASGQQNNIPEDREVDTASIMSGTTSTSAGASGHVDTPSPPRGRLERSDTSGPMTGKGMRPLRLVQNEEEASKARKAANRQSWFGGLFGANNPAQQQQQAE